jgi:hypothetical protein
MGFEPAKFYEIPEKLLPDALEIGVATDEERSLGRGEVISPT